MTEIEFSFMSDEPAGRADVLRSALAEFEAQYNIHVRTRTFPWETAWAELVRIGLYRSGPDVSEVGSTWTESLVSMGALRPFTEQEAASVGGPSAFVSACWQSALIRDRAGRNVVQAIPMVADPRVLYYRHDLLERAGLDERVAFQTLAQLEKTLHSLQEAGIASPWVMPTRAHAALQVLASWVWGAGGHFISADGRCTQFNAPAARAGILAYFNLRRFMPPSGLDAGQALAAFLQGQSAVTIAKYGLFLSQVQEPYDAAPQVVANLAVAPVPAIPFVGGSNLVIWKHSRHPREAVELVRFLTAQHVQSHYIPQAGLLPARLSALGEAIFTNDPSQVISETLKIGRGFSATYMWGLVEERLAATLGEMWEEILANPDLDVERVVTERVGTLAERLDDTLSGRYA